MRHVRRCSSSRAVIAAIVITLASSAIAGRKPDTTPADAKPDLNDPNRYLNAVREFADNVLKHGRDTYGPKHTPLFVDGLNIHTHEPVKWISPDGEKWILSNLASQQNLFRTLDGLTTITDDPKYRQAAMEAIKYAFANLRSPNGLLYWGRRAAYDARGDRVYGDNHELKSVYPHYELMWKVDPRATRRFIDSFWSVHILDWSNLDMNRFGTWTDLRDEPWVHEYKGGPVFFRSKLPWGWAAMNAGSDLFYAATWLTKLSGDEEPLIWGKRLAHRYVETRHPKTGIGCASYNYNEPYGIHHWNSDEILSKLGPGIEACFGFANPKLRQRFLGQAMPTPGTVCCVRISAWLCPLLLGELTGSDGEEFRQWALQELTAVCRATFRKEDISYVPILTDGTNLNGYLCREDDPFGPKGTTLEPVRAGPVDFWVYATVYRVTADAFMWEMVRSIAMDSGYGDIGTSHTDRPQVNLYIGTSDPYALLGFLELYRKTEKKTFLDAAQRIGNNILGGRFHKGFFVPNQRHTYAKFDAIDSLVLLHLQSTLAGETGRIPQVWPSVSFFIQPYRHKEYVDDNKIIYMLTGSSEVPRSLQETVIDGSLEEAKEMISQGAAVNDWEGAFRKRALHFASINGRKDMAELLLASGAQVDVRDTWRATPLHYAVENGHEDVAELLIANGADTNARDNVGHTPLHRAAISRDTRSKDIFELLIAEGANVNARNKFGTTALQYSASLGKGGIVEYLIADGADVDARDNEGRTALWHARYGGHKEIVELLRKHGAKDPH